MDCVYKEFLEIRTRITELLVTGQSEITTVGGEGTLDSDMDSQAIVNDEPQTIVPPAFNELNAVLPLLTPQEFSVLAEPPAFQGQFSDLKYGPLGFGTSTLPEGTIPQSKFTICTTFIRMLTVYDQACCPMAPLVSSAMGLVYSGSCLSMTRTPMGRPCPSLQQVTANNHVFPLRRTARANIK